MAKRAKKTVSKQGSKPTGSTVPVKARVKRHRQRIKKGEAKRIDLHLTPPAAKALEAVLRHYKDGSVSDLFEALLMAEWDKIGRYTLP
jgi:hypothetical protein